MLGDELRELSRQSMRLLHARICAHFPKSRENRARARALVERFRAEARMGQTCSRVYDQNWGLLERLGVFLSAEGIENLGVEKVDIGYRLDVRWC